jgi:hypothetical protein
MLQHNFGNGFLLEQAEHGAAQHGGEPRGWRDRGQRVEGRPQRHHRIAAVHRRAPPLRMTAIIRARRWCAQDQRFSGRGCPMISSPDID